MAAIVGQRSVEEDRQLEIGGGATGERERRLSRPRLVIRPDRNDRHDVRRADPRVNPLVASKVDAFDRYADTRQKRLDDIGPVADNRKDRAIVVGIDVRVEEPRRPGQSVTELGHRRCVAGGREIGNRLERERHGGLV